MSTYKLAYTGPQIDESISKIRTLPVTVGVGGDYPTLPDAIADVVPKATIILIDNTLSLSGGAVVVTAGLTIMGMGVSSTRLEVADQNTGLHLQAGVTLKDFTISADRDGTGGANGDGIIQMSQTLATDVYISNMVLFLKGGHKAAISMRNYNHTCFLTDVNIFTTSIGIDARGYQYHRNVNIFLSGNNTGTDYVGYRATSVCRLYLWGSKVGTGYGATAEPGFGANLEIENDADANVRGFYSPSSNPATPRFELHGLESYVANSATINPAKSINCVRMEKGIARLFSGLVQAETAADWSIGRDLSQSGAGIIEVYAMRYSTVEGNLSSANQGAVNWKTVADDGLVLDTSSVEFSGSDHFCDASGGDFELQLPADWAGGQPPGLRWTFIKSDNSANSMTLNAPAGGDISGSSSVVLSAQYDTVTVLHGDSNTNKWYII